MRNRSITVVIGFLSIFLKVFSQTPYTGSFIARLGTDTVLIETYNLVNNHLYGKAYIRVPEDYVGVFDVHFYPGGSIRTFNIEAMHPQNSSIPFDTKGLFPYRMNMLCEDDTCTWFISSKGSNGEYSKKHVAPSMDFVGGWTPIISLMEWNCLRLINSSMSSLPLRMINDYIGVYPISVRLAAKDSVIFGGPFLEYTKIKINSEGRINSIDGTGTPWNYFVTKHSPINIDEVAKRMSKTPGIGIPSPEESIHFTVAGSKIDLKYGRPFKRGRKIFGGIVPYDSVWRTGASHPTTITLENDITIGNTKVAKGKYSLYTIPRLDKWTLIFNTDIKQWPTDPKRSNDFAQLELQLKKVANIAEQFKIEIEETRNGGILKFHWDDVVAFTEFEVVKN
jgi:hypothetical protein